MKGIFAKIKTNCTNSKNDIRFHLMGRKIPETLPDIAICLPCSRQTRDCRLEPSQTVSVSLAVQSRTLASVSPNNKNTSYKSILVV